MKKVLCIQTEWSINNVYKVDKDQIYTVIGETVWNGVSCYKIAELPDNVPVDKTLFKDMEQFQLVTFTKLIEEYIVHAN